MSPVLDSLLCLLERHILECGRERLAHGLAEDGRLAHFLLVEDRLGLDGHSCEGRESALSVGHAVVGDLLHVGLYVELVGLRFEGLACHEAEVGGGGWCVGEDAFLRLERQPSGGHAQPVLPITVS